MSSSHALSQLAAGLGSLPVINSLQTSAVAACINIRALHGHRRWCDSNELLLLSLSSSRVHLQHAAVSSSRSFAAAPQAHPTHDQSSNNGSHPILDSNQVGWAHPADLQLQKAEEAPAIAATPSRRRSNNSLILEEHVHAALEEPEAGAAAAAAQPSAAAAATAEEPSLPSEGDVLYPSGPLLCNIQRHWQQLQEGPSSAAYTQRISFGEFGYR